LNTVLQNILYVEDEPDIQRIVKLALEMVAGMRVIACSSGADAIARSTETAIDLMLLDVMMPQMDGPTTLQRLREIPALAKTPVVFMTAKAHPSEVAYFKSLGALDVIAKPFDPMALADVLRAIWARAVAAGPSSSSELKQTIDSAELSAEARFTERMAALTAQFQRELPERLAEMRHYWQVLKQFWNLDALNSMHRCTHNLAGAGSTFGYDALTTRARTLDRHLKVLLAQQQQPDAALWVEISTHFADLETEIQRVVAQLQP
jgi:two-component system, OmpR family, response regulator